MKSNRSLGISTSIQSLTSADVLTFLADEFPQDLPVENTPEQSAKRNRVFTDRNTLLVMALTATQEDKSLKNSVDLFYTIHQDYRLSLEQKNRELKARSKKEPEKRSVGRPPKRTIDIPKSLQKDISLNTAGYSKARSRVPVELTRALFEQTRITNAQNEYSHWHGLRVFMGDGTYLQLQDTKAIRERYNYKWKGKEFQGYPQALLEVFTERGTGQVYEFAITDRHTSELPLCYAMLERLPERSLLLLDDLYNCYEILAKCARLGVEIVVPGKRKRAYEVLKTLSHGDELVRIKQPNTNPNWQETKEAAKELILRRMVFKTYKEEEYILYTTILDERISKDEFWLLYLTRWDIEIEIREVKTIMGINILRSKTPEMLLKELTVSLASYNLIRKLIYASIKGLLFPPKEDFIFKFYTASKNLLVDKKGRVYSRWSTGRKPATRTDKETSPSKAQTQ